MQRATKRVASLYLYASWERLDRQLFHPRWPAESVIHHGRRPVVGGSHGERGAGLIRPNLSPQDAEAIFGDKNNSSQVIS